MSDKTVADLAKMATDAWCNAHATEAGIMAARQADLITAAALAAGMPVPIFAIMSMSLIARAVVLQVGERQTTISEEWERMKSAMDDGFAGMEKLDD